MINSLLKLLEKIKDLPDKEQEELLSYFEKIAGEETFKKIVKNICSIKDEQIVTERTRKDTLERINRFTASAKTPHTFHHKDKKNYMPILEKGELVEIRFSGLGSEIDQPHYAIVWNEQRQKDPIVVIPTTSFKKEFTIESAFTFNIGRIGSKRKETVVLLDQITTISRKRIDQSCLNKTRKFNNKLKKMEYTKISTEQENRIKDGFKAYYLGEDTLYDYLKDSDSSTMPILFDSNVQFSHLHRPFIRIDEKCTDDTLVYSLYEKPNEEYIVYKFPCKVNSGYRKALLRKWVSAKCVYDAEADTITKSREEVRKEAYDKIKEVSVLAYPLPQSSITK